MALDPIPYSSDVLSTDKLKAGKISDTWHRFLRSWESKFDSLSKVLARLNFINLSDVPQNYTGQAGKVVKVKATEDGLEFGVGGSGGVSVHNDLTGIQGGTVGDYQHLTSTELSNVQSVPGHISNTVIHFTNGSILHNDRSDLQGGAVGERYHLNAARSTEADAFLNNGNSTHTQLDSERTASIAHRADTEIHKVEIDEIESTYVDGLEDETIYSLANSPVKTLSYTYDSSDRVETISNGLSTWTLEYYGTGEFKRAVKA